MTIRRDVPIDGTWDFWGPPIPVENPYSGEVIAEVPSCAADDVARAVAGAHRRLGTWPQHERAATLDRIAELAGAPEVQERLARTISAEAAKPITTARVEANRTLSTLRFSATECRKLAGELLPIHASAAGASKAYAYALARPIGVVGAISPFNFPLNLVAHKLGPAVAAGCPVVLKPATTTPLSAIELVALFEAAGMPPGWISVVTGPGGQVGDPLVDHPDVPYLSFTGSSDVGWGIRRRAFKKKVGLELGSNSPLVVCADGDWATAAQRASVAAFSHAGQSCISTQRIFLHSAIADDFLAAFVDRVRALVVGDPADDATDVSQLITTAERDRVVGWIDEATGAGATLATGGVVGDDGVLAPTVVCDVTPEMKVHAEEVFGPLVTVSTFDDLDDAFARANHSHLGLQAGVFTRDLASAAKAAEVLDFGGVMINDVPTYRADQQPYGGVRDSGNTREGPAYAVREMTELRTIIVEA